MKYQDIVKGLRDGLIILEHSLVHGNNSLDESIAFLNTSPTALSFRNMMKMHEFNFNDNKYCNKFRVGKCTFGDKCGYKYEVAPRLEKKDIVVAERIRIKIRDKIRIRIRIRE